MVALICKWSGHRQSNHTFQRNVFIVELIHVYISSKYNSLSVLFRFVTILLLLLLLFASLFKAFQLLSDWMLSVSIADTVINFNYFLLLQLSYIILCVCSFLFHGPHSINDVVSTSIIQWIQNWLFWDAQINQRIVYFCKLYLHLNFKS